MTHTHVAGAIHGDVTTRGPVWLQPPSDVNQLVDHLWSSEVTKTADGELSVAGVTVSDLAARVGTPALVVDEADLRSRARSFVDAFTGWDVFYAGKSFLSVAIATWVADEGLFLDVCSGGELAVALRAGVDPLKIGMHGNNKSDEELHQALDAGVGRLIVDSADEIERLSVISAERDARPGVLVRVTAGVEAHTHEYIATAREDQKFGIPITGGAALDALLRCHTDEHLNLLGIHSHIGSQIFDAEGFDVAGRRTLRLHAQFAEQTGYEMPEFDMGGGFGIAYTTQDSPATPYELAEQMRHIVESECKSLGVAVPRVSIEPGRAISGPAAFMLYRVGTVKTVPLDGGQARVYIAVDGGMSDNIRTALYGAEYSATLANRRSSAPPVLSRVVGKHCESGDIVVRDEFLPADVRRGDLIAVPASGAYSRSMASNYNHVPRPPVVSVADGKISMLLRRETVEDLLSHDVGQVPWGTGDGPELPGR
ncbi:diaminopimelate decarboxylase [Propionibacteriaceae bacterium Y1700]|uniref:diaminopimelate decarboxylase n=1 Tax=Microlunatus sp. Y1700 TaxID=3418487 RepID=UPI003DA6E3EE